jgi:hypothetical protein
VRTAACTSYRNPVPVCDGILGIETVVGKDGEEPVNHVPGAVDAVPVLGGDRVIWVVGRHEFVDGVEVVLVPKLFDVPAHHGLVSFSSHPRSFFQAFGPR